MSSREKADILGSESNTKADARTGWMLGGTMRRRADRRRKFLLLSGERVNGRSRQDYGEPG